MNTTQEIDKRINIANQELSLSKNQEQKKPILKKIKVLKLKREIARIQDIINNMEQLVGCESCEAIMML